MAVLNCQTRTIFPLSGRARRRGISLRGCLSSCRRTKTHLRHFLFAMFGSFTAAVIVCAPFFLRVAAAALARVLPRVAVRQFLQRRGALRTEERWSESAPST